MRLRQLAAQSAPDPPALLPDRSRLCAFRGHPRGSGHRLRALRGGVSLGSTGYDSKKWTRSLSQQYPAGYLI